MKVTCAPWSKAATSNAQRVRVESFSKISAISLPTSFCSSRPSRLAAFSSAARSMQVRDLLGREVGQPQEVPAAQVDDGAHVVRSFQASRAIGQVMQWPPPRPRPSSEPAIVRTSMPAFDELQVRRLVPLVRDDHAGREGDDVVAVVPLRALRLELVAGGRHDLQLLEPERVLDLLEERALRQLGVDAAVAVGRVEDGQDLRDDRLVDRADVPVAEREDRVEVHRRPLARHLRPDHEPGGARRRTGSSRGCSSPSRCSARCGRRGRRRRRRA